MAASDESELIERTLAGDGGAFASLVEKYQRKLFRISYSIVRNEDDADVVTQDAFVQAYVSLRQFQQRSSFESWLTRIAINRARDVLRRRRFSRVFSFRNDDEERETTLEPIDERPDAERQILASQLRAAIERAEKNLSAQQLVIFRLRHYEELSLEEIAEHLGLRSGTVRAHLFRAVHKIREELAAWRSSPEVPR